jgi:hypothetical protein
MQTGLTKSRSVVSEGAHSEAESFLKTDVKIIAERPGVLASTHLH